MFKIINVAMISNLGAMYGKSNVVEICKYKSCPCALTEHYAMKAYWGSAGIAPRIL